VSNKVLLITVWWFKVWWLTKWT